MRARRGYTVVIVLFTLAALATRDPHAEGDPWSRYEAEGARIGALRIQTSDVFDLSKPDEDYWLARAANVIHITTRESVIRSALLFKMGDLVDVATLHETERLLRSLPWVQDASIELVPAGPGSVQAVVKVHDGWSLKASLKFNHAGGQTDWRIRLHEVNLLGYGKEVLLSHERGIERTTDEVAYRDPLLFGSRWTLEAGYSLLSDGNGGLLKLVRPFYQLSVPWSVGVEATRTSLVETLYQDTQDIYTFPATIADASLYARWLYHFGDRTAWRAGVEFRVAQAAYGPLDVMVPGVLPQPDLTPRRFRGLLGYWAVSQDRYGTFEDLQSIGRTEDLNLGWDGEVHAGYFAKAFGSDTSAWYLEYQADKAWRLGSSSLALLKTNGHGRLQHDGGYDVLGLVEGTLYNQSFPYQTIAADLQLTGGYRLDPEHALYIGGFDGLRGYPNFFREGDRRWLLSVEDRIITPWKLWSLVQVGFVAYADAGAIRTADGHFTKTYANVGAGLRFGNLKSTFGRVLTISVAVPLVKAPGVDNYQIVVGNVIRF